MARRLVPVSDIVGVSEILELAGGVTRHALLKWRSRARRPQFPKPIAELAAGELWDRRAVVRWLEEHR